jgi:aspartyl-tRNA(Asn)/glutamyl-tRNA(Gln) amidotransferase subunit A
MSLSIHSAADQLRQGTTSAVELLERCLERIDARESSVRAWVLVDRERAREEAKARDQELHQGRWRGPLHGIPLGIKDIIDVFDWPTAAGSRSWARSVARADAAVVRKLREAGAVLVGKTVTTLFASFDPPPTRNPWHPGRTPGGSSSGSAAALACGMCLGAVGSQTGGSITRPAAYCGVPSCKPTYGRCSTQGVLTLAASMDHIGPLARCVRDLALLLQVLAGPDPCDPQTLQRPAPGDYASGLNHPRRPCLGRLRGLFEELADPEVRSLMDEQADALRSAGAVIREVALPASFGEVVACHRVVMAVEAARYHHERLRRHPEDYGPCITGLLKEGIACPAVEYARVKEHQERLRQEIPGCFEGVDALLCPATTTPAPDAATTGDPAFNSPWSYTGLPAVSLPAGWSSDHLPLSIQLVGQPWDEENLFGVAVWCEQVLGFEMGLA